MSATELTAIGVDTAVVDMMNAVFADYRDTHPPAAGIIDRDPTLWRALDDLGLVRLTGAESGGGSGAGWSEAAELLSAAVRHGVRIPLAEHDLLACWLLDATGVPCNAAVRTVSLLDGQGVATAVPWADGAEPVSYTHQMCIRDSRGTGCGRTGPVCGGGGQGAGGSAGHRGRRGTRTARTGHRVRRRRGNRYQRRAHRQGPGQGGAQTHRRSGRRRRGRGSWPPIGHRRGSADAGPVRPLRRDRCV